jgi:hypothetical protein
MIGDKAIRDEFDIMAREAYEFNVEMSSKIAELNRSILRIWIAITVGLVLQIASLSIHSNAGKVFDIQSERMDILSERTTIQSKKIDMMRHEIETLKGRQPIIIPRTVPRMLPEAESRLQPTEL